MAKACKAKTLSEQRVSFKLTETNNLRKSLQTCRADENEEKLEGLLLVCKKRKSNKKAVVIERCCLSYFNFWRQALKTINGGRGFLNFADAYGLYSSFFENPVEKADFRDNLLHSDYGLRVFVATVHNARYSVSL